jgi:hypothetical protein
MPTWVLGLSVIRASGRVGRILLIPRLLTVSLSFTGEDVICTHPTLLPDVFEEMPVILLK